MTKPLFTTKHYKAIADIIAKVLVKYYQTIELEDIDKHGIEYLLITKFSELLEKDNDSFDNNKFSAFIDKRKEEVINGNINLN